MVAVTNAGRALATNLGFKTHTYKEQGAKRTLCYAAIGSLKLDTVTNKLNLGTSTRVVLGDICSRFGIRDPSKIMMRC